MLDGLIEKLISEGGISAGIGFMMLLYMYFRDRSTDGPTKKQIAELHAWKTEERRAEEEEEKEEEKASIIAELRKSIEEEKEDA